MGTYLIIRSAAAPFLNPKGDDLYAKSIADDIKVQVDQLNKERNAQLRNPKGE